MKQLEEFFAWFILIVITVVTVLNCIFTANNEHDLDKIDSELNKIEKQLNKDYVLPDTAAVHLHHGDTIKIRIRKIPLKPVNDTRNVITEQE